MEKKWRSERSRYLTFFASENTRLAGGAEPENVADKNDFAVMLFAPFVIAGVDAAKYMLRQVSESSAASPPP